MPLILSTSEVRSSPVLPFDCVTSDLPLRSANERTLASFSATTWKCCGYRFASWQTLVVFFGNGARPSTPSTVDAELPKPTCALPSSLLLDRPARRTPCLRAPIGMGRFWAAQSWPVKRRRSALGRNAPLSYRRERLRQ